MSKRKLLPNLNEKYPDSDYWDSKVKVSVERRQQAKYLVWLTNNYGWTGWQVFGNDFLFDDPDIAVHFKLQIDCSDLC